MPDALTVDEFISDTLNDVRHPLKCNFISKISSVRCTVYNLDESLETDRNVLIRSKKLVKSVVASGIAYADQITSLCDFLERLGQIALEGNEPNGNDIATSLCKFSVVHRDLANMTKHLMQNLNSIVVFPMETFMQGDIKCDLKKPFEKALKDYEYKYDKLRKEKLQTMKETGCYIPEAFTEGMTKDLEKERRRLQLETCEYLIKVNELKAKRGADLLQHLIDFFYVQTHYLRECLGVMDHFGKSMSDLSSRVNELHKINDIQKRRLVDTREEVKGVLDKECDSIRRKSRLFGQSVQTGVTYAAQPTQVNRAFGTKKSGFLLKKSDGKVKRVWQRRRVRIADGELCLYHADETKPPVRLTLLTCQVKLPTENAENDSNLNHSTTGVGGGSGAGGNSITSEGKFYFDLVSNSRTYNFQAEDEQEYEEWISILNNAMQEEFNKAMNGEHYATAQYDHLSDTTTSTSNHSVNNNNNNKNSITNSDSLVADMDLVYSTLTAQGNHPRNRKSDSFGDSLPGSVNDLLDSSGSQVSHSHESHLDNVDTFSTDGINPVESKARPSKSLIQSSLRFSAPGNEVFAERLDLMTPFQPEDDDNSTSFLPGTTALHIAVETTNPFLTKFKSIYSHENKLHITDSTDEQQQQTVESFLNFYNNTTNNHHHQHESSTVWNTMNNYDLEKSSHCNLPLVEFILQNSTSGSLKRTNKLGDTALHHAARYGCVDALKLIVQAGGIPTSLLQLTNHTGQTALDIVDTILLTEQKSCNDNHNELLDAYKQCQYILKLANFIASNLFSSHKTTTTTTTNHFIDHATLCSSPSSPSSPSSLLFPNLHKSMDRLTNYRHHLTELLNQLNSIDWCPLTTTTSTTATSTPASSASASFMTTATMTTMTTTPTTTVHVVNHGKSHYICKRTLIPTTSTMNAAASISSQNMQNVTTTTTTTSSSSSSSKKLQTKTLHENNNGNNTNQSEETFSLSPIMKNIDQLISTRNSCESCTPKPSSTGKQITFDENQYSRDNDVISSVLNKPIRSYSQHSPSIHYGSALATLPRKKGPAPRPPSVDDQMNDSSGGGGMSIRSTDFWNTFNRLDVSRTPSSSMVHEKPLPPNDHIDIILDVLEEKPIISESLDLSANTISATGIATTTTATTTMTTASSSGICTSPAVPPKPSYLSNTIYSTLPNRNSQLIRKSPNLLSSNLPILYDTSSTKSSLNTSTGSTVKVPKSMVNSSNRSVDSIKYSLSQHTNDNYQTNLPQTTSSTTIHHPPTMPTTSSPSHSLKCMKNSNQLSSSMVNCKLGDLFEALYDCEAENPDELTFNRGEIIQLLHKPDDDDDWWEGFIQSDPNRRGMFPVTYVKKHFSK
ncbi:unnamed protein product [Schistosoma turkestanicum]|nr:unnamed protein product [Schistosoma turkestanicum]